MKTKARNIFQATNALKVLSHLVENPGEEFLHREIQQVISVSRAGVYVALQQLVQQKVVAMRRRGRCIFYQVIHDDPVVKQYKVLKNILALRSLICKLAKSSMKIFFYGSRSRGENDLESDIDLFILARDPKIVKEILSSAKTKQRIQAVIKTPAALEDFRQEEQVFYSEIERGIVLWEEKT